ncbi:transposase [Priestia endophytica]|nr:transposase [Priestia endophytica]
MPRPRLTFTSKFKLQMVQRYKNRKSRSDLCWEYDLIPSASMNGLNNTVD